VSAFPVTDKNVIKEIDEKEEETDYGTASVGSQAQ